MNWLWISGWAVPPTWLVAQAQAAWPEDDHIGATPTDAAQALKTNQFDRLGGYSLGALCLLQYANSFSPKIPVLLLAPIFAFAAEHQSGGRMARAQLQLQRRRLRNQPTATIADFFQRTGLSELNNAETTQWNSTRIFALHEELGWLEDWRRTSPPENWLGFVGEKDPLLDAAVLKKLWPALHSVPQAGHAPGPLMQVAKVLFPGRAP